MPRHHEVTLTHNPASINQCPVANLPAHGRFAHVGGGHLKSASAVWLRLEFLTQIFAPERACAAYSISCLAGSPWGQRHLRAPYRRPPAEDPGLLRRPIVA